MSSITASYSTMQMTRVAIFSLVLGGGIAYLFLTNKAAKEKAAKEKAAKEKAAKEIKIATKLGVAVDKIVSKSLFCFCSFFSSYFFAFLFYT
jgi:3-phosphoglycerate kinase